MEWGKNKHASRMLPEHRRDEQGCLQTTLLRTQKSHTLEQCVPLIVPSYVYLVSHLSPSIYLFLPSYGDLVFHHTLSLSLPCFGQMVPPLSLCLPSYGPLVLDPSSPLSAKLCSAALSPLPLYVPSNGHTHCVSLHWLRKTSCGRW